MNRTPTPACLLALCEVDGVRLLPAAGGGLTVEAARDSLTPELLAWLKSHKAALLALLPQARGLPLAGEECRRVAAPAEQGPPPLCPCGSTAWRDVPIHEGQSIRRDCRRCGLFLHFPVWYEKRRKRPAGRRSHLAERHAVNVT